MGSRKRCSDAGSDDYFTRALYGRVEAFLDTVFSTERFDANIESLDKRTAALAQRDLQRWPRWGDDPERVDVHRAELREYVRARRKFLRAFLARENPTTASQTGPWSIRRQPRVAVGRAPPRALAFRSFRYISAPRLSFTEIAPRSSETAREYVEIANLESRTVDISGWTIPALGFVFPSGSKVPAKARIVVVRDPVALVRDEPTIDRARVFGPYPGHVARTGEELRLRDAGRSNADDGGARDYPATIDVVVYQTSTPWPRLAPGQSLELHGAYDDNDLAESWRASKEVNGSPGR